MFICPFFVAASGFFSPLHEQLPHKADALNLATPQDTHPNEELKFFFFLKKFLFRNMSPIYLSKSSLSRNTPTARGKAHFRCPSRGYSTPGGGRSRSAHVTFSGNQNLSLQIQAEIEEIIGDDKALEIRVAKKKKNLLVRHLVI